MTVDGSKGRAADARLGSGIPRIAVVPERLGNVLSPCASIRLVPFFDALRARRLADVHYAIPSEIRRLSPDIIVWHRVSLATPGEIELLVDSAAAVGAQLVYDLDDNLLDMAGHVEEDAYQGMVSSVRMSLAIADQVWVSTPRLRDRVMGEVGCKVETMLNVLDPYLWIRGKPSPPLLRPPNSPLQFLYMGTRTHEADLAFLVSALDQVNTVQPGSFQLTVIGVQSGSEEEAVWIRYLDPPSQVGTSYPAFVSWFRELSGFDLGVAPLMSSPFNDCKSSIKVLDYAAVGLPAIASDMPAYADFLRDGFNCVLAENHVGTWADCLIEAIADPKAMRLIAGNAWSLVTDDVFEEAVNHRARNLRCFGLPVSGVGPSVNSSCQ